MSKLVAIVTATLLIFNHRGTHPPADDEDNNMSTTTERCPDGKDFIWVRESQHCDRCHGTGEQLRNWEKGCTRCHGTGDMMKRVRIWNEDLPWSERYQIEDAEAEAKYHKKMLRQNPGHAFRTACDPHSGLESAFVSCGVTDIGVNTLRERATKTGSISADDAALVFAAAMRIAKSKTRTSGFDDEAPMCYAPSGRRWFSGAIIRLKDVSSGRRILVKTTDGWLAWGCIPGVIDGDDISVGDEVRMKATLKVDPTDPGLANYSRPCKAKRWKSTNSAVVRMRSERVQEDLSGHIVAGCADEVVLVLATTIDDAVADIESLPDRFRMAVQLGLMTYAEAAKAATVAKAMAR